MNMVQYGMQRDEKIVRLVNQGKAFTRTQIEKLFFNQKDSTRKCQLRLKKISESGRLNKLIRSPHEPAIYYSGKKPLNIDHTLIINDVYTAIMTQKKSYFKVNWSWEYPILDKLRADAMIDIYDLMSKRRHVIFLEVERYADHRFVKNKNYETVSQMQWTNEDWAIKEKERILFPAILIVTETKITIKSELDFFVVPISSIKSDIYSIIMRR